MATAPDVQEGREDAVVTLYSLNPDPPHGYLRKFIVFLQIRYSIDPANPQNPYKFEFQFERRIPDDHAGFFIQTAERSGWTVIAPHGTIDIPIDGDTFVVIETVRNGTFTDLYWSTNEEAIMTREDRTALYGDLKYGDGTTWQELADYKRDHPGDSNCRWISFKARLDTNPDPDPNSPLRKHKFSYHFYLKTPANTMEDVEVDPDIKNPSA